MTVERYQNLVIGSGESGKYLAWNLAKLGQKTVVVERSMIGGACPNVACLPSKNVIYSAKVVSLVDPKDGLGVVTGQTTVDMAGVARRKREMVNSLTELHLDRFKASGAELVMGEARFIESKTVQVTSDTNDPRHLRGDRVFLCVGSRASIPKVPGLAEAEPMTHVEAINLERLPAHLIVMGGGYVGLEFAQAIRRFGSRVTLIHHSERLLDKEDPDLSAALFKLMQDEGIEILLRTEITDVAGQSGSSLKLQVRSGNAVKVIEASDILVAAGRTPNTDRLDVARVGVKLDARGYIQVNEKLQTNVADVWAMGDCAGSPQFTHVAYDDFRVVLSNLTGGNRTTHNRLIPYCLFTDPELAHVGLSETDAKAKNIKCRVISLPMSLVMRMRTISETRGFMKALIGEDDRILGSTAFGAEASELVAAVQTAMLGNIPYTALRDSIFTHPTAAEGLVFLFSSGTWKAMSS